MGKQYFPFPFKALHSHLSSCTFLNLNFPALTSVSTPVPDIRHCGWAGGPDREGGPPEVGAEDDPPLPRGGRLRLHAVMEGRPRVRRDHTQVTRQRKNGII